MNREEKWLGQQITLLRTHLRELKALSTHERQAREALNSKHQQERERLLTRESNSIRLALALLRTEQAEALTQLISVYSVDRLRLLAHQGDEYSHLTKAIKREKIGRN